MRFARVSAALILLCAILSPIKLLVRLLCGAPGAEDGVFSSLLQGLFYLVLLIICHGALIVALWLVRRFLVFADGWENLGFKDLDVGVHGSWYYQWFLVVGAILLLGVIFDGHGPRTASISEALAAFIAVLVALVGLPPTPDSIDAYDPLPVPMPFPPKPVPDPLSPSDTITLAISWFFRRVPGILDTPATNYELSIEASRGRYEALIAKEHAIKAIGDYGRFVRDGLSPEVCEAASQLRLISERDQLGSILEINNVLALAQRFRYASDIEDKGVPEYPKYPLETMFEDRGDCEDHAIVAAACLVRLGYDVRLVSLEYDSGPGHMALAVAGAEDLPDAFAIRDPISGRKFYYCEATTDAGSRNPNAVAFRMGEVPDRDRRAKMELVSVV